MGSFEPLSSSSMGRRWLRNPTFWLPRMPNTEAESVDDIVDASRIDGNSAKWILVQLMPESHQMKTPVRSAVRRTPTVDSTSPGSTTGRIAAILVPMPPEKRMMQRAIIPMNWAVCMLLNWMPTPSVPKAMPTRRKISRSGSPNR